MSENLCLLSVISLPVISCFAVVAQLVEQLHGKEQVSSPNLLNGSKREYIYLI